MTQAPDLVERVPEKDISSANTRSLKDEWRELCERYLPIQPEKSVWRYSRPQRPEDQPQGWKLHISATVLSAAKALGAVAPLLTHAGYLFKAAASLEELSRINAGLYYGFSQIGKFITVYPKSTKDAVALAARLHELTRDLPGPPVPYDKRYRDRSAVYYRYGSFGPLEIETPEGVRTSAIRNDKGEIVRDRREPGAAVPDWETDPFTDEAIQKNGTRPRRRLKSTIKPFEALSQRGKGGVYRALDFSVIPARHCILKEGRLHGETDWQGRDGYWRLKNEERALTALRRAGVDVPEVYCSFSVPGNRYLAMEFVEGQTLQSLAGNMRRKLPIAEALRYGALLAESVHSIHQAGWVWRDCKPGNAVVSSDGTLRPLDFEGACRIDKPDLLPWGTPGYLAPEAVKEVASGSRATEDLYALGASLHHLLSSRIPSRTPPAPIGKYRRKIPALVKEVVMALLDPDPGSRPDGLTVLRIMSGACEQAQQ
jgi:hypothetical protein